MLRGGREFTNVSKVETRLYLPEGRASTDKIRHLRIRNNIHSSRPTKIVILLSFRKVVNYNIYIYKILNQAENDKFFFFYPASTRFRFIEYSIKLKKKIKIKGHIIYSGMRQARPNKLFNDLLFK